MQLPRWFHLLGSPPFVYRLASRIGPWIGECDITDSTGLLETRLSSRSPSIPTVTESDETEAQAWPRLRLRRVAVLQIHEKPATPAKRIHSCGRIQANDRR